MSEVGKYCLDAEVRIADMNCLDVTENLFGVELELENLPEFPYGDISVWRCVEEGGLGDFGREFVFRGPLNLKQSHTAIESLFALFHARKEQPQASGLCGVHIHVNMLNASYLELSNLALCAAILEPMLFELTGDRCQNRYCIPVMSTKYADILCQYYGHSKIVKAGGLIGGQPKYCGVNFLTLLQYGTIEFRQMAGSVDVNTLKKYVSLIDSLVTHGKQKKFLERLLSATINSEIDQICRQVFLGENPPAHIVEEIASNIRFVKMRLKFAENNIQLSLKGK